MVVAGDVLGKMAAALNATDSVVDFAKMITQNATNYTLQKIEDILHHLILGTESQKLSSLEEIIDEIEWASHDD